VILSVHLADVGARAALGALRAQPAPTELPGLRYAAVTTGAPLGGPLLPVPQLGRVGLIAGWDDDRALDGFLAEHPLARRLADGWHARLEPLRTFGAWPELPGLPEHEQPVDGDEPVAVLTLGRLRVRRALPFLRANRPAADQAVAHPALLAATALARPPRLVATFSLWRSAAEMREYAIGHGGGHLAATRAHHARPFHHASAFIRLRPYAARGRWDGREPLAEVQPLSPARNSS